MLYLVPSILYLMILFNLNISKFGILVRSDGVTTGYGTGCRGSSRCALGHTQLPTRRYRVKAPWTLSWLFSFMYCHGQAWWSHTSYLHSLMMWCLIDCTPELQFFFLFSFKLMWLFPLRYFRSHFWGFLFPRCVPHFVSYMWSMIW
jgi:hypothetical protein